MVSPSQSPGNSKVNDEYPLHVACALVAAVTRAGGSRHVVAATSSALLRCVLGPSSRDFSQLLPDLGERLDVVAAEMIERAKVCEESQQDLTHASQVYRHLRSNGEDGRASAFRRTARRRNAAVHDLRQGGPSLEASKEPDPEVVTEPDVEGALDEKEQGDLTKNKEAALKLCAAEQPKEKQCSTPVLFNLFDTCCDMAVQCDIASVEESLLQIDATVVENKPAEFAAKPAVVASLRRPAVSAEFMAALLAGDEQAQAFAKFVREQH